MEKERDLIYLAGPISKNPNAFWDFAKEERKLRKAGFDIFNPARHVGCVKLPTHADYMDICIPWVDKADAIYMMRGWTTSEGAIEEYKHAFNAGKAILFAYGAERDLSGKEVLHI